MCVVLCCVALCCYVLCSVALCLCNFHVATLNATLRIAISVAGSNESATLGAPRRGTSHQTPAAPEGSPSASCLVPKEPMALPWCSRLFCWVCGLECWKELPALDFPDLWNRDQGEQSKRVAAPIYGWDCPATVSILALSLELNRNWHEDVTIPPNPH